MTPAKKENCFMCGKQDLTVNEIGLCKKFLGREIKKFMCINCLGDFLEVSTDDLLQKIEEFKGQGCVLFK